MIEWQSDWPPRHMYENMEPSLVAKGTISVVPSLVNEGDLSLKFVINIRSDAQTGSESPGVAICKNTTWYVMYSHIDIYVRYLNIPVKYIYLYY